MTYPLTEAEHELITDIGRCMSDFHSLEQLHPADIDEFKHHVHALQNIVMSRAAQRAYPDKYPIYKVDKHKNK